MAQSMTGYCPVNGLFDLSIITPQVNRGIVDKRYTAKGYGKKSGRKCACCGFDLERFPFTVTDDAFSAWNQKANRKT